MKRRWKILLVVLLIVAVVAYVVMPHSGARRSVEALKQQLRAKGEKLTMAELAPRVSSNGLVAGKAFTNAIANYRVPPDYPVAIILVAPGVGTMGHSSMESIHLEGYARNLTNAASLRAVVTSQPIEFELDYSQGKSLILFHLAEPKRAAQLLSITALQAMHKTNLVEAWLNITTGTVFLQSYQGEHLLISDLVRVAAAIIAISATWDALQEDWWTEEQLSELQARWEALSFTNQLDATIRMERAYGIAAIADARKEVYDPSSPSPYIQASASPSDAEGKGALAMEKVKELKDRYDFWKWKLGASYEQEHYSILQANAALQTIQAINKSGAFLPALQEFRQRDQDLARELPGVNQGSLKIFDLYFDKMADAEAARRLLVVAISLKRYRMKHNLFPNSLSELVPALLGEVPKDPWDGKALRYRLQSDGRCLLYSVGRNGEDNDGDASRLDGGIPSSWHLGKDIVWPRLATSVEVEKYRESRSRTNSNAGK